MLLREIGVFALRPSGVAAVQSPKGLSRSMDQNPAQLCHCDELLFVNEITHRRERVRDRADAAAHDAALIVFASALRVILRLRDAIPIGAGHERRGVEVVPNPFTQARCPDSGRDHGVKLAQVFALENRRVLRQRAGRPHREARKVLAVVDDCLQRLREVHFRRHRRDDLAPLDAWLVASHKHVLNDVLRRLSPAAEHLAQNLFIREDDRRPSGREAPRHLLKLFARRLLPEPVRQLGIRAVQFVVKLEAEFGEFIPDGDALRVIAAEADVLSIRMMLRVEAREIIGEQRLAEGARRTFRDRAQGFGARRHPSLFRDRRPADAEPR
jgi:hypothetical protein